MSSTFFDLQQERQAVVMALLELEAMPAGMELFPATDEDAWTLIQQVIASCDYYVLLIGGRYGSVDGESELSFTEREYDFAVSQGKPVLAFLHGDPGKISMEKSEQDSDLRRKLESFRAKVEETKHVKYWTSQDDLAGKVSRSFISLRRSHPAIGWVRGDVATSTESLNELNLLRKELDATREKLQEVRASPPPGSGGLSQGEDKLSMSLFITGRTKDDGSFVPGYLNEELAVITNWDEMFSGVGPVLLDEAEQGAMMIALSDKLLSNHFEKLEEDLTEVAGEPVEGLRARVPTDTFGTIIIQFKALGLIESSERKRSVSDQGTYWTLTSYGEEHLTALRALRRASEPASVSTKEGSSDGGEPCSTEVSN